MTARFLGILSTLGYLNSLETEGPAPPLNGYITEDGVDYYVTEDGLAYYVQES